VIEELLQKIEEKLKDGHGKATLADYLKLVQLRQELEDAEPREIRVTWVEPERKDSDSGE
jgi:hypothetical protein